MKISSQWNQTKCYVYVPINQNIPTQDTKWTHMWMLRIWHRESLWWKISLVFTLILLKYFTPTSHLHSSLQFCLTFQLSVQHCSSQKCKQLTLVIQFLEVWKREKRGKHGPSTPPKFSNQFTANFLRARDYIFFHLWGNSIYNVAWHGLGARKEIA